VTGTQKSRLGALAFLIVCEVLQNWSPESVSKSAQNSAFSRKWSEIGCVFVTVLQARNREEYTSCACVRDGFCKRVFVTVFYKRVFVTVFTSPADATPVADGYRR